MAAGEEQEARVFKALMLKVEGALGGGATSAERVENGGHRTIDEDLNTPGGERGTIFMR